MDFPTVEACLGLFDLGALLFDLGFAQFQRLFGALISGFRGCETFVGALQLRLVFKVTGVPTLNERASSLYGKAMIGWETLPEKLQRDHRDLSIADVLRIQHLLGEKPHEAGAARRQMIQGVSVDRRLFEGLPRLVVGAGLDNHVPEPDAERVAEWLGAEYEPFPELERLAR